MKNLALVLFLLPALGFAQPGSSDAIQEIKDFQAGLDAEYKSPESPLDPSQAKHFKGHEFFPIDLKFRITGKLIRTENSTFFKMKATGPRLQDYRVFGTIEFTIDGKEFALPVYQSRSLMDRDGYRDYLFLPFTDLTNGNQSYEGGRYIGLRIPEGDEIIVDFNQAYNPYCAYSDKYSCPRVPPENHLDIEIPAGVQFRGH